MKLMTLLLPILIAGLLTTGCGSNTSKNPASANGGALGGEGVPGGDAPTDVPPITDGGGSEPDPGNGGCVPAQGNCGPATPGVPPIFVVPGNPPMPPGPIVPPPVPPPQDSEGFTLRVGESEYVNHQRGELKMTLLEIVRKSRRRRCVTEPCGQRELSAVMIVEFLKDCDRGSRRNCAGSEPKELVFTMSENTHIVRGIEIQMENLKKRKATFFLSQARRGRRR